MKKILTVLLAAVLAMGVMVFAACGKDSIVGTYKFYSMSVGETEYKVGDNMYGVFEITEDYMTLEMNEDNTCKRVTKMVTETTEETGTWKKENGNYYLTLDGVTMIIFLDGNTITIGDESSNIILKK